MTNRLLSTREMPRMATGNDVVVERLSRSIGQAAIHGIPATAKNRGR